MWWTKSTLNHAKALCIGVVSLAVAGVVIVSLAEIDPGIHDVILSLKSQSVLQ